MQLGDAAHLGCSIGDGGVCRPGAGVLGRGSQGGIQLGVSSGGVGGDDIAGSRIGYGVFGHGILLAGIGFSVIRRALHTLAGAVWSSC
ncbi:Uncharacterised protein [Mycobacteroides abscessus subsp. abscessus]|nr:Uncharacterised protein [Mycobacteroides abscessus subsp. abscessus]